MKRHIIKMSLCVAIAMFSVAMPAQNSKVTKKLAYWGSPDTYLNTQASVMLDYVDETLSANPPTTSFSPIRKMALYNLDEILHETKYDKSEALRNYIFSRTKSVINDLSKPIKSGMRIYKIYNDGFIVRTKTATVAFDLCGRLGTVIPDSLMEVIVDKCDVMFITHNHDDHADKNVVSMFVKMGKTVYAPTNFWEGNNAIKHVRSEEIIDKTVSLKTAKIQVKIFPGHQDELMDNNYVVTFPEGFKVAHTGDQYNEKDMAWIKNVNKQVPSLNVLIVECWISKMNEVIAGFNPKVILTGHENEMGHSIDHREAFWLTYYKMEKVTKPYVIMSWGEWYNYKK